MEETHLDTIRVCRQTHAETALLPFALGCFRLGNKARVVQLLGATFPEQRGASARVEGPCLRAPLELLFTAGEFPGRKAEGVGCVDDECD